MGLEHALGVREHQRRRGFLEMNIRQGSENREKADSRKNFRRPTQNARRDALFNLYRLQSPAICDIFGSNTQSRE
ncbi:hypothetical protein ACFYE8_21460 [Rhizobium leguminosarum]|uniref:hypothetical protein n=1 Tax=Rhizobium leguminosarum TaxID=384 RepID=UPI0036DD49C8